ncbi:MAG: proteasome subunit alpha [Nitrospirae bacterium]|nr:MAG: proteasome subunit alpha [Nitrospirota bacterium]
MALPFYVSPEQMMQDKAEYAKKGIAKGRSIVAMEYDGGVLLVADNPSSSLYKISEIYDNIAFSGAGKYSEFENLRKAGIQHADLKGLMYSREDVTARSLANGYSQILGTIFSQELKPFEVELLLAQVGAEPGQNELFRISFDGSIFDERRFTVIGGRAETILQVLRKTSTSHIPSLVEALTQCIKAIEQVTEQTMALEAMEVAVLDRSRSGRKFRRIPQAEVKTLLAVST